MSAEHEWLFREEKEIQEEMKYTRKAPRSHIKFIIYILAYFFVSSISAQQTSTSRCPHCERPIEMRGIFGDTWVCENCGYENYDGINRCGICGERR